MIFFCHESEALSISLALGFKSIKVFLKVFKDIGLFEVLFVKREELLIDFSYVFASFFTLLFKLLDLLICLNCSLLQLVLSHLVLLNVSIQDYELL